MNVKERYKLAKEQYEKWGINVDKFLEELNKVKISVHCWQGDDVKGFEVVKNALSEEFNVMEITLEQQEVQKS